MGTYEVLFILSPKLTEEEITSTIDEMREIAKQSGPSLIEEDAWGKRRLAYQIQKSSDGIYHLFVFEGEPGSLSELDRRMKNSDRVMRHMIVRTDLETRRAKKKAAQLAEAKAKSRPAAEAVTSSSDVVSAPAEAPAAAESAESEE